MAQALATGRSEDESWRIRRDGTRLRINEIMTPLRAADGGHLGFTKISRDLTERKAFEDALRRAHDELEQRVLERTSDLAHANESLQVEVRERRSAEAQIKALFERLVSVQEEERRRIARDIHDQLGQQITALRMNLESLASKSEHHGLIAEQVARTQQLAEELDRSIDFLARELRPASLDRLGLSAALQSLLTSWSERFGIAAEFAGRGGDDLRLPRDVENNLYNVAQEALHNVVKHAHATHVSMFLDSGDDEAVLVIEDNGCGFAVGYASVRPADSGLGLVSMRERAMLAAGTLEIESSPGRGTTIFVRVPKVRAREAPRG